MERRETVNLKELALKWRSKRKYTTYYCLVEMFTFLPFKLQTRITLEELLEELLM